MKFVALVSGGKDSCYNILHCLKNGHQLIALANLHPLNEDDQELDSFMFQTVGHDIVSLYTQTIDVPLYKHFIKPNTSKYQNLNYISTKDDEIENLFQLLNNVKRSHPDLEAVSVGAILSSYQRTRVENVCSRLGLTVLSYLWQRNQSELMSEMCNVSKKPDEGISSKMDARLIKVAAIGLDEKHLNKSLPEIYSTMLKLNRLYDVHICGEGGEFETMVLDAPFFDKGYLEVISTDVNTTEKNNGVFNVRLHTKFVEREFSKEEYDINMKLVKMPPLLEEKWDLLLDELSQEPLIFTRDSDLKLSNKNDYEISINTVNGLSYISNILPNNNCEPSVESQAKNLFEQLDLVFKEHSINVSQVLSSTLYLSNMVDFSIVNNIYNTFFAVEKNGPLPPSRSCVEVHEMLPHGKLLQLSVVIDTEPNLIEIETENNEKVIIDGSKNGLHVQGRSYWAPCNIGPYSQAIWKGSDKNMVSYISGQIALIPQSMVMVDENKRYLQSVLSLKHFDTIKETITATRSLFMKCFISDVKMVPIVAETWQLYCCKMSAESELWVSKEDDNLETLIIVKVSSLPRDALVEWGGVTCKTEVITDEYESDSDIEDSIEISNDLTTKLTLKSTGVVLNNTIDVRDNKNSRLYSTLFIDSIESLKNVLKSYNDRGSQIELYFTNDFNLSELRGIADYSKISFNPVESIYDYKCSKHKFAMHTIFQK